MSDETGYYEPAAEPATPSLLDKLNAEAKPRPRPEPLPRANPVRGSLAAEDSQTVAEWLKQFSGNQVRITLNRVSPDFYAGHSVAGVLDHFDELIDEEYVKGRYGGGKYQIKAQTMQENGQWRYAGARTFKIAGNPNITGEAFRSADREVEIPVPEGNSLSERAMAMMERNAVEAAQRAERAERESRTSNGVNEAMMALMIEPYKTQIGILSTQLAEKERQLSDKDRTIKELSNVRPDTSRSDALLEKVIGNEASKLDGLRMQFDSERRMLMDSHKDEVKRVLDRHDYEMKSKDDALNRETRNLERSFDSQVNSLKSGYESRLESKDNRVKDLERQLHKTETELGELRARKEKGPMETLKEVAEFQEMANTFMGKNDEEDEGSTFERVTDKIVNSPIVQAVGARIVNGPAPPPPPPPKVRKRLEPAEPVGPPNPLQGVDANIVAGAVTYMETAIVNGVPPETFAGAVRSQMPQSLIDGIQLMGIDSFLDAVKLGDTSPLATQVGRTYARRVMRALAGDPPAAAPATE